MKICKNPIIVICLFCIAGCIPDIEIPRFRLEKPVISSNSTTVLLKAAANPQDYYECGFYVATDAQFRNKTIISSTLSDSFSASYKPEMSFLGGTIYYQAYVSKGESTACSTIEKVNLPDFLYYTSLSKPTVQVAESGTIKVSVQANYADGISPSDMGICYSEEYTTPTWFNAFVKSAEVKASHYSVELDLVPGKTYYLRGFLTGIGPYQIAYSETISYTVPETVDLSISGTANCYIVSMAGRYCFNALVKGNSGESVGDPVSADVLWESFGTTVRPNIGDIIQTVSYQDGYVYFTTPRELNNGNAVIAVRNSLGTILWSWHIWVCEGFDTVSTQHVYRNKAGTMMDRNLGATTADPGDVHCLGLLFQWGRKDPFLSGGKLYQNQGDVAAASTGFWPTPITKNPTTGTIAYVTQNPMTLIAYADDGGNGNADWLYSSNSLSDTTRWSAKKGCYDPCPPGWRVPDGGPNGVWATAFNAEKQYDRDCFVSDKRAWNLRPYLTVNYDCWYPLPGHKSNDGSLWNVGVYATAYWSCGSTELQRYNTYLESLEATTFFYCMEMDYSGYSIEGGIKYNINLTSLSTGLSANAVRCQKIE